MPKNPFLIVFEKPISETGIKYLQSFGSDFAQVYPHTFLIHVQMSPSAFRTEMQKHFEETNHFTCVVQKTFGHSFYPDKPSSSL